MEEEAPLDMIHSQNQCLVILRGTMSLQEVCLEARVTISEQILVALEVQVAFMALVKRVLKVCLADQLFSQIHLNLNMAINQTSTQCLTSLLNLRMQISLLLNRFQLCLT